MFNRKSRLLTTIIAVPAGLLFTGIALAQDPPNECVELGALAYSNWTKEEAGGSGSLPAGVINKDYIRCKACHGWDYQGMDGGYVRRSRKETRPNAGAGDGDSTLRAIMPGAVTAGQVLHVGTGRTYEQGTGSWVARDEMHSASNTAAHANGFTLGNQHPDFSADGLTQNQADCLAEFLNFEDGASTAYFANINTHQNPVQYTIIASADAAAGETFYADNCDSCHGDPAGESPVGIPEGGILAFLEGDGKFSEFAHKVRWGVEDEIMTRDGMGSPTSADVADMMLWLQEEGGTGFGMTPGMTGTWWNGPERSGEGFPVEVGFQGDGTMILWATFFTYDDRGRQTWLSAVGEVDGTVVTVDVFRPEGRMWGHDFDPADGENTPWGSGTFTFTSCKEGHMKLEPNGDMMGMHGFSDIEYDLIRFDDVIISGLDCPN